MRTFPPVEHLAHRLESATVLDRPAAGLAAALRRAIRPGPVEDALTGTTLGHPLHPVLVSFPIGCWWTATVCDLVGADRKARRTLVGFGVLAAVPTALAGAADWLSTIGAGRRLGFLHAVGNATVLTLQTASWLARRRGRDGRGTLLSLAAAGLLGGSVWLGEHLVYARGIGVDHTAFETRPADWVDVAAETEVPTAGAVRVVAAGVPVLLTRIGDEIVALADTCTHRGGPLHEGRIADGCVTCPLHASTFDLRTGYVVRGPASRPQPRFDVQVVTGQVLVRAAAG